VAAASRDGGPSGKGAPDSFIALLILMFLLVYITLVSCVMTNNVTSKRTKIKKMVITLLQHIAEMSTAAKLLSPFLANRTNGRAYVTDCLSSVRNVLCLNGAS